MNTTKENKETDSEIKVTNQPKYTTGKKVDILKCLRCNHEWIPRSSTPPYVCSRCRSPYWNKERIRPKKPAK